MSTVISSGFRYTGPNGIVGCRDAFNGIREEVEQRSINTYINFITNITVGQIDRKVLGLKPEFHLGVCDEEQYAKKPLSYAFDLWEHRRRIHANTKDDPTTPIDHAVATECTVHLFPRSRRVIGIFIGANVEWMADLPFVTDHSYWNNSDKPDTITRRDWSQRALDWRDAFPTYPAERSLMMKLDSKYEPFILILGGSNGTRMDKILEAVPSTSERAKLHARSVVLQRNMWNPDPRSGNPDDIPLAGEARRYSSQFYEWRKSPEGQRIFDEVEAELALTLPIITESMLKNNA